MVNTGDYMASTETVYIERKNKNIKAIVECFEERQNKVYTYGDYSDLDFSRCALAHIEFHYSKFCRSNLNYASLNGSTLIGVNFNNACMENSCLDNCFIFEADFSYAILRNASFVNVSGRAGLLNYNNWCFVGFLPVSFRHADLTNADFTGADLTGADFTGAILYGADFTDSVLDGAIFTSSIGKELGK